MVLGQIYYPKPFCSNPEVYSPPPPIRFISKSACLIDVSFTCKPFSDEFDRKDDEENLIAKIAACKVQPCELNTVDKLKLSKKDLQLDC